ncbi:MAG: response regulator [bacterium]|nr:response regulator [bacterium]
MARILIVDNCEIIRNLLTDFLEELGHTVETAIHGQDGIDKALNNEYDAVFCDIHMPKKNGYQVYVEVSGKKAALPFIMTDSLPDDLANMAVSRGAHTCLSKPFTLEQVRTALSEIFIKDTADESR